MNHPLSEVTAELSGSPERGRAYQYIRDLQNGSAPGGNARVLGTLTVKCAGIPAPGETPSSRAWDLREIAIYCHAWLEALGVMDGWRAMREEYDRAKAKHGDNTLDSLTMDDDMKFFALMEEVGEIARALTYDREHAGELVDEITQTGALALAWYVAYRKIAQEVHS
ncbi:hypothetical protein NSA19_01060 [Actinomyces bowdenii]|uniref:hypothetical protein n=1 Tax=Actinomyces bowdenii TaxID=131109 RepID=UPI00214AA91D|nr:hypothetical protein [Actinomyces bowdenii]MCR2051466.1 hypothetical protein [Actinomyces bowdenii]